jgi:hypothetical protein
MFFFKNKKNKITLINEKWERLETTLKFKNIPRYSEFIYIEDKKLYYRVENVVYSIGKEENIFIVVKEFTQKNF